MSAILLLLLLAMGSLTKSELLPQFFLSRQDLPVACLAILFLLFLSRRVQNARQFEPHSMAMPDNLRGGTIILAAILFLLGIAGHYAILAGHQLSRDEQMALFDAQIFAQGRFAVPVGEPWASVHKALNLIFIPHSMHGTGWASDYRPVNAMLHMLAIKATGTSVWLTPTFNAIGLFATWRISLRLFPKDREAQWVAVILYAASTQALAMSMTSYSMPAHLAFNMVWLMLFLHNRWYSHLAALCVGFLAIGLHQVVYHPLFAGPILFFCLVCQRRWLWSAIYAVSYAAMLLFWTRWMQFPLGELGLLGGAVDTDDYILTRIAWALTQFSPEYLWIQAANLVRFFAWEHLLLLPLLVVGASAAFRTRDPLKLALIATLVALVCFKLIMRPYQGHGWGFRYAHGLIGVACLIGAVGWQELRRRRIANLRHFHLATAIGLFCVTPWLLWNAHDFSGRYSDVVAEIYALDADMVIVENTSAPFANDVVLNPPTLEALPVKLLASELQPSDMAMLCDGRSVAFVEADALSGIASAYSYVVNMSEATVPQLRAAAQAAGCEIRPGLPAG